MQICTARDAARAIVAAIGGEGAGQRVTSDRDVLNRVEAFLSSRGIPPATFGRAAMGDPRFVFDLRAGRQLRVRTRERVRRYLARQARATR